MKRKRFSLLILLLLTATVAGYALYRQARRGPVYEGRPIGDWVALALRDAHDSNDFADINKARAKVVKIGAPAVPFIAEQGFYDRSHVFHFLEYGQIESFRYHHPRLGRWVGTGDFCVGKHLVAVHLLTDIGRPAHSAIPDLFNCLNSCPSLHYINTLELIDAMGTLSEGSTEAVPYLTKLANGGSLRAAYTAYELSGDTNLFMQTCNLLAKEKPDELTRAFELNWLAADSNLNQYLVPLFVKIYSDPCLSVEQRADLMENLESRSNDATAAIAQLAAMNQKTKPQFKAPAVSPLPPSSGN